MYSAPGSQKSALAKNASNFGRLSGERLGVAQNTISGIIRNSNLGKIDKDPVLTCSRAWPRLMRGNVVVIGRVRMIQISMHSQCASKSLFHIVRWPEKQGERKVVGRIETI